MSICLSILNDTPPVHYIICNPPEIPCLILVGHKYSEAIPTVNKVVKQILDKLCKSPKGLILHYNCFLQLRQRK